MLLALALVATGIVLTLIFGKPSEAREPAAQQSKERAVESLNCFAPVTELFWRKRL